MILFVVFASLVTVCNGNRAMLLLQLVTGGIRCGPAETIYDHPTAVCNFLPGVWEKRCEDFFDNNGWIVTPVIKSTLMLLTGTMGLNCDYGNQCTVFDSKEFVGGNIRLIERVRSKDQCCTRCRVVKECMGWSWNAKTLECTLKDSTILKQRDEADFTSGIRRYDSAMLYDRNAAHFDALLTCEKLVTWHRDIGETLSDLSSTLCSPAQLFAGWCRRAANLFAIELNDAVRQAIKQVDYESQLNCNFNAKKPANISSIDLAVKIARDDTHTEN